MLTSKESDENHNKLLDQTLQRIRRVECFICIILFLVIKPLFDTNFSHHSSTTSLKISDIPEVEHALSSVYEKFDVLMSRTQEDFAKYSSMVTEINEKIIQIELKAVQATKRKGEELKQEIVSLLDLPTPVINEDRFHTPEEKELQDNSISQTIYSSDSIQRGLNNIVEIFLPPPDQGSVCENLPILAPVSAVNGYVYNERVDQMMNIIHTMSSMEALNHYNTPQYKAACWIMYDDELQISQIDRLFPERYVLAVLLFAINSEAGKIIPNDICDHEMVITCNDDGHVIKFDAKNKINLENSTNWLPTELTQLRFLESLNLENSKFVGTIPTELGRLDRLETLILDGNHFTGTLPSAIGKLKSLKMLKLSGSSMEGSIPSEIGLCTQLEHINVTQNSLEGSIPTELFNCDQLNFVDLYFNQLTGTIPRNMHQLQRLEYIRLNDNNLSGQIPSEVGLLSSLERLWLGFNQLTGTLPIEIRNMKNLTFLVVNNNNLVGSVPNIFDSLNKLFVLQLSNNHFIGSVPSSIWDHPSYFALLFRDNQLHGRVPNNYCSNVTHFQADVSTWGLNEPKIRCDCCDRGECFIWDVDTSISEGLTRPPCPASNVHKIHFHEEYWISDPVANITVHDFHGGNNFFDANICLSPTGCYSMVDDGETLLNDNFMFSEGLEFLTFQDDCDAVRLCGTEIDVGHPRRKGLNHLTQVVMPNTKIFNNSASLEHRLLCWLITQDDIYDICEICDGTILQRYVLGLFYLLQPQTFDFFSFASDHTCLWPGITCDFQMRFVEQIHLPQQNLTGTLITEIGLLTRIQQLDLNGNNFTGTIDPSTFLQMPNLELVDIGNNQIGGNIPNNLLTLPRLKELNISNNLFSGTLPDDIEYAKTLEIIDFENNLLQGPIARGITLNQNLKVVILSRNSLDGTIPSTFGLMENLKVLSLNENILRGRIPSEIFSARLMEVLTIQGNTLTGSIPTQICSVKKLEKVKLSHNSLKGTIPQDMRNLTNIKILHLHENRLHGSAPTLDNHEEFITDCGDPSFLLPSRITCMSCTICCNSLSFCQINSELRLSVETTGYVSSALVPIGMAAIIGYFILIARKQNLVSFLQDIENFSFCYNQDSVYCMIFTNNIFAWVIYLTTTIIQILLYNVFLVRSNFWHDETDWEFTMRCSENNDDCIDENSSTVVGWLMLYIVIVSFLGHDLVTSILQLWIAVESLDIKLAISGAFLCFLTILGAFTSIMYNKALASSDTELIMNAVVLLFVSDLDEKILMILKSLAPHWTHRRVEEINNFFMITKYNYSTKYEGEVSSIESSTHDSDIVQAIPSGSNNLVIRQKDALNQPTPAVGNYLSGRQKDALNMLGMTFD